MSKVQKSNHIQILRKNNLKSSTDPVSLETNPLNPNPFHYPLKATKIRIKKMKPVSTMTDLYL